MSSSMDAHQLLLEVIGIALSATDAVPAGDSEQADSFRIHDAMEYYEDAVYLLHLN